MRITTSLRDEALMDMIPGAGPPFMSIYFADDLERTPGEMSF
jgi:hypothetical protein